MAARVIGSGVVKSGSPMVRLMTSFISASMSKKRRIPDGGIDRTRSLRKSAGARVVAGWMLICNQSTEFRAAAIAESSSLLNTRILPGRRLPPASPWLTDESPGFWYIRSPASTRIGSLFVGHGSGQVAYGLKTHGGLYVLLNSATT